MVEIITLLLAISLPLIYFPFSFNPLFISDFKWFYGLVLAAFAFSIIIKRNFKYVFIKSKLDIALIFLFLSNCISVIFSFKPSISLNILLVFLSFYVAYYVGSYIKDKDKRRYVFIGVIWGSLLVSCYYFFQKGGLDFLNLGIIWNKDFSSTFSNANNLAGLLVFSIPIQICFYLFAKNILERIINYIIFMTLLVALMFTQTRASWVGVIIAFVISIFLIRKYFKGDQYITLKTFAPIVLGVGIIVSVFSIFQHNVFIKRIESFADHNDQSIIHRKLIWRTAGDIIHDYWFIGAGLGMYEILHPHYQTKYITPEQNIDSLSVNVHNDLLESAVDGGVIGLFAIIFLFINFYIMSIKPLRENSLSKTQKEENIIILSSCTGLIVYGLFHSALRQPTTAIYFFLFMGMVRSAGIQLIQENKKGSMVRFFIITPILCGLIFLTLRPIIGNLYFAKAASDKRDNNLSKALSFYNKAQIWKPYDYKIYINKGNIHMRLKKYDKAIDEFKHSLEFHPYSSNAYNSLAVTYYTIKKYEEAKKNFESAVEINPNFFGAYFNNGLMHLTMGKPFKAIILFEQARNLQPSNMLTRFYLAGLYKMTGDTKSFNDESIFLQKALDERKLPPKLVPLVKKILEE